MSEPVAVAHDYLLVMRGAERTFAAIAACWPGAPVYTLLFDAAVMGEHFAAHPLRVSYLQRLGVRQAGFRRLLPLYPHAIGRIPVADHELLVSSSSAFAHGLRTPDATQHVCYCHTPFRYAWHERARALTEIPAAMRPLAGWMLERIRSWDRAAAARVTHYIANSRITRERIARLYDRDAPVVHPPVDVDRFRIGTVEDYFLVVCEIVAHKRVDVALEACRLAGARVKVVGTGPEAERLRVAFGGTAEFLGRVDDRELESLYSGARALIVPNVEEFGIAAVEAQAAGRPVVALDRGGTSETVRDGETGILLGSQDAATFAEALSHTDFDRFDPARIAAHAASFSTESFQTSLVREIERLTGHRAPRSDPGSRQASGRS